MSLRLLSPENRLTFENLLTPVMKLKRMCASQSLTTAYRPRRKSRLARATAGVSSASRIGLSYSSTSTATRRPVRRCSTSIRWRKRAGMESGRALTPASSSMAFSRSVTSVRKSSGPWKCPLPKLTRTTGSRTDQSQCAWMARPSNSASLPSNSSLHVSRNRLLPKHRGRERK